MKGTFVFMVLGLMSLDLSSGIIKRNHISIHAHDDDKVEREKQPETQEEEDREKKNNKYYDEDE